ncbi:conserved hypothetical protein [uncultured Eubacteriales bacterium]|uniref:Uncharacterized protein n=1 Tax=uncultured Eubacteriales bacterium TaxID=172733 RepID=A0A212K0A7_9FIRM|nr:conserved hypothetical protein [uncultured Eubacteriales bacterium]
MAEFEDKLNAILGNQEAMGQIVNIAKALTADGGGAPPSPPVNPIDAEYVPVEGESAPVTMPDLSANPLAALGDLDPRLIQTAMRLFSEYSTSDDRKTALLAALKPFLKEERLAKMDKAVQIAKLSRVIRVAFQMFKGGDGSGDV